MLRYVVGDAQTARRMATARPLAPFSEAALGFLNDLSKALLREGRAYSDVATFGFWCRRSALNQEKAGYADCAARVGRGVVFHSTPSNVPVNFAFSFASALLAGNASVVRLPAKDFAQVRLICDAVAALLHGAHAALAPYLVMVKYPPVQAITDAFSALCDMRVVWGGDSTVAEMRRSPLKPRAGEITFADRHSLAVIDADAYLACEDKARGALDFYNDTYFSDQNACTAPRAVVWLGREKARAKERFWALLHQLAREKYAMAPVQAVGKLTAFCRAAANVDVRLVAGPDGLLARAAVARLDARLMDYKYNSGFFFEYDAESLDELLPLCGERCQTLSCLGVSAEALRAFVAECGPRGVDRAVPLGHSMDFSLRWDGHDLIRELSRVVDIRI